VRYFQQLNKIVASEATTLACIAIALKRLQRIPSGDSQERVTIRT
jgi:hypothetical protein